MGKIGLLLSCIAFVSAGLRASHLHHSRHDDTRAYPEPEDVLKTLLLAHAPAFTHPASHAFSNHRNSRIVASLSDIVPNMEVRWVTLDTDLEDAEPSEGALTMPVFPVGKTFLPNTTQELRVFQQRYLDMYNDIITSGTKRFVVCNDDLENGKLAEVGIIFNLDTIRKEFIHDRIVFVGDHLAMGRAKITRVLNPRASESQETYLRAEVEMLADQDLNVDTTAPEEELCRIFEDIIHKQTRLAVKPAFSNQALKMISFSRPTDPKATKLWKGFWGTVEMWQMFMAMRINALHEESNREIQYRIAAYMRSNPGSIDLSAPGVVDLDIRNLPEPIAKDIAVFVKQVEKVRKEFDPYGLQFQALVQSMSHKERLAIFLKMIEQEHQRLTFETLL